MTFHYIKSFLSSIKRNNFFYSVNLIGFLTGFLVLIVISTFVYQELSFDKFHKNAENIYRINSGGYGVTPLCFGEKLQNAIPEISKVIRFSKDKIVIINNDLEQESKTLFYTDSCIFKVFSFNLLEGNVENVLKDPYSVVISKSLSNQLFGNSSPVGNIIKTKKDLVLKVTGVMEDVPENSHLQCDIFASIETLRQLDESSFNCGAWGYLTYLMLERKSDVKSVEEKINAILKDFQMTTSEGKMRLKLESIKKLYFDFESNKYDGCKHGNIQTVIIYSAISILLIFLVIINYINLFIAISSYKIKTIAIKKIIGASNTQIIKQFVIESLGVSFISFFIVIAIIELYLPEISNLLNLNISELLNWSVLYCIFFLVIAFIGLLTGYISGFSLSKLNVIKALKNESLLNSQGFQRKLMLAFQLIIVATLLNSTFIINSQIKFILSKDLGFNYENVIYFRLDDILQEKKNALTNKFLENPKIKKVSFSSGLIGEGFGKASIGNEDNVHLCYFNSIDPDYIDLYKLNVKEGRNFLWDLTTDFENACIINEQACKVYNLDNPVNEMLGNRRIIGIIKDFNFISLHKNIEPLVISCENTGSVIQLKIEENNAKSTLNYIKETCSNLSPDYNFEISFLKTYLKELYKTEFDLNKNLKVYSTITFIIALLGIFGLALFMIKKKFKEISIRKLFGAKLKSTFLIIAKEYFIIVFISNLIAFPLSYLFTDKWGANFQYKVGFEYIVYLKTFLIVLVFTFLAIIYMILKSHSINPINALKEE
jgi:putative ABC transport system permease protein